MDLGLYRQYLEEYVREALQNTEGTNRAIREYLSEKQIPRFLVRHREEKQRALAEARRAFDEHSHWPVEIVISHLGINLK